MGIVWFFVILAIVAGAIAAAPLWFEQLIVFGLRTFHIFAFPNAIRIAVSLERDGDQWDFGARYLKHPTIGSINIDSVYSVCVHLDEHRRDMIWRPNFIERRIVWDAVQVWRGRRIDQHLQRTLPT